MIVVDTDVLVALGDRRDDHHRVVKRLYARDGDRWVVPWVILPEVDYLLATRVGPHASATFLDSLAEGAFSIEWGRAEDLARAAALSHQYQDLALGLVDASVMAMAERLKAEAIATFDRRHFGVVKLRRVLALLPG